MATEPEEWPAQIIARLSQEKAPAVQQMLRQIADTHPGTWLKPLHCPLIAAGGPIEDIYDVEVACDDSKAVVWTNRRRNVLAFRNSAFRLWDVAKKRQVGRLDLPFDCGRAAIANPPRCAVIVRGQQDLSYVNLETAVAETFFSEMVIEQVTISTDGAWAVASSVPPDWDYFEFDWNGPRTLRLFDLRTRTLVRAWTAHKAAIWNLALSANGRFLVTASDDQSARLFDLLQNRELGHWRCENRLRAAAITPDGSRLAYASDSGIVTVRDQAGSIVKRWKQFRPEPGCLQLSDDGQRVVSAGDGGWIDVVDLRTRRRSNRCWGTQPFLSSLKIDPDARHALTGELGGQLIIWDLTRVEQTRNRPPLNEGDISGIWASQHHALVQSYTGLSQWDLTTGEHEVVRKIGSDHISCSPAGGIWALTRWNDAGGGRIRLGRWGKKATKLFVEAGDLSRSMFTSLELSRNGMRISAAVHPTGCRVWNVADGRLVWHRAEFGLGVRPFLSPSGRYLLLAALDGGLEVVDLETGDVLNRELPEPGYGPVVFVEDDSMLVAQGANTVLLNWKTGSSALIGPGRPSSVSADGGWVVIESNQRKLTLWKLPEARRVATFTLDAPLRHSALSLDGRYLVAGDGLGHVHILKRQG